MEKTEPQVRSFRDPTDAVTLLTQLNALLRGNAGVTTEGLAGVRVLIRRYHAERDARIAVSDTADLLRHRNVDVESRLGQALQDLDEAGAVIAKLTGSADGEAPPVTRAAILAAEHHWRFIIAEELRGHAEQRATSRRADEQWLRAIVINQLADKIESGD